MKFFEGVRVYAVPFYPFTKRRCALTLPGIGILCSPSLVDNYDMSSDTFCNAAISAGGSFGLGWLL